MSSDPLLLHRVIGDVIDPFSKSVPIRISFSNKLFINGAEFKPSQVVNKPRFEVGGDDLRVFYTLVMVDPDAPNPSNPTLREYLHWSVTDIPATTDARFGCELFRYENPTPTAGIHRMVFALFKQLGRGTVFVPDKRQNFNTREFPRQYNLGLPVAAAYFTCQRETGSGGRRFRPELLTN